MRPDLFERRKKAKLAVGVLAVAIIASALVGIALFYLGKAQPRF